MLERAISSASHATPMAVTTRAILRARLGEVSSRRARCRRRLRPAKRETSRRGGGEQVCGRHSRTSCSPAAAPMGRRQNPARSTGLLPAQDIRALIRGREIQALDEITEEQIQPASLDLRLGSEAWRVRASFLPGPGASVQQRLDAFGMHRIDLSTGARSGKRLRLRRAAAGEPGAEAPHVGAGQPEELDRPARRVHPADHRWLDELRSRGGRLQGADVRRDQPAHLQHRGPPRHQRQPAQAEAGQPARDGYGAAPAAPGGTPGGRRKRRPGRKGKGGHRRRHRASPSISRRATAGRSAGGRGVTPG